MEINNVSAKDGSIAAAGDVTIINIGSDAFGNGIVGQLFSILKTDKNLESIISRVGEMVAQEEKIRIALMANRYSSSSEGGRYSAFFDNVGVMEVMAASINSGIESINDREYLKAHKIFGELLNSNPPENIKSLIISDYFISGYVGYSLNSNINAISDIISELRKQYRNYFDRDIDFTIAEAHQEIATRQITSDMLIENESILVDLLKTYGEIDIRCLNLLGLLYRRLGEREDSGDNRLYYLAKALDMFAKIQRIECERMSVEARNNWSIALVRHFELTKDAGSLDKAEVVLKDIDYNATTLSLSDFLALPKSLNNRGNIYKQRMSQSHDIHDYNAAIEEYNRTDRFWDESGSPYEWAMIQKNKADVRCNYMEIFGFNKNTAKAALNEISQSLKYRNKSNAPYQYDKSMDIKNRLDMMLANSNIT